MHIATASCDAMTFFVAPDLGGQSTPGAVRRPQGAALSIPPASNPDGNRFVAACEMPDADLLNEYLRRTAAGDRTAFQTLYDLLSPYVRDSAACLFGSGDTANDITNSVFVDVWQLAGQYQPGGEGVRAWVLNVAGGHTMSRYRPS